MPQIDVPENLYRQLETEANGGDINETLWKMVGSYRRATNPQAE